MTTAKQAQRQATRLFRACLVNGGVDEARARRVVDRLLGAGRPGTLPGLRRFHRLLRLDQAKQAIDVRSAAPLAPDIRTRLEAKLAKLYGPGRIARFTEDPTLIAGVRITIGSTVFDGTVQGRLAALEAQF